jgi:hypothetical protein
MEVLRRYYGGTTEVSARDYGELGATLRLVGSTGRGMRARGNHNGLGSPIRAVNVIVTFCPLSCGSVHQRCASRAIWG